jgi:hypothetical protein
MLEFRCIAFYLSRVFVPSDLFDFSLQLAFQQVAAGGILSLGTKINSFLLQLAALSRSAVPPFAKRALYQNLCIISKDSVFRIQFKP